MCVFSLIIQKQDAKSFQDSLLPINTPLPSPHPRSPVITSLFISHLGYAPYISRCQVAIALHQCNATPVLSRIYLLSFFGAYVKQRKISEKKWFQYGFHIGSRKRKLKIDSLRKLIFS